MLSIAAMSMKLSINQSAEILNVYLEPIFRWWVKSGKVYSLQKIQTWCNTNTVCFLFFSPSKSCVSPSFSSKNSLHRSLVLFPWWPKFYLFVACDNVIYWLELFSFETRETIRRFTCRKNSTSTGISPVELIKFFTLVVS